MSITMYYGRAGSGKTRAVYERIQQVIQECPGEPIILLVPEPATYRVERELAEFMPQKGFTTVRVVGFGRLAYQVYQSIGNAEVQRKSISKLGRSLLLRLVMKRKASELGLLSQATKRPEFASVLQTLFSEFRSFRIGPDELERGATTVSNTVLQKKLRELATCMVAYEEELQRHGQIDGDPIMDLVHALPQSPLMENCHVFVDGFHWFTPVHFELLYMLFDLAKESVITVDLPDDPKRLLGRQGHSLFSRPLEILDTLYGEYGTKLQFRAFEGYKRSSTATIDTVTTQTDVLKSLESNFFHGRKNPTDERIPLVAAYNREREADWIARDILAYLESDENARYRDVCIMLRESETYGDTLDKVFTRYGIPHFMDRQRPMKHHPLGELLTDLLGIVKHNYSRDTMFRLLKTDLTPLSRDEVDELENYVLEFGIDHFQWEKEQWSYMRRRSNTPDEEQPDAVRRARVNTAKNKIMAILSPWFDFATSQELHSAATWCEHIYGVLEDLQVPRRLYEWSLEAEAAGDLEAKSSHEQMYNAIINFLDEMMILGDEEPLGLDEVIALLEEALEDVHYSMIPPSLDHVAITTIERAYSQSWKRVYVMGLNQGVFPQSMGDEGLIKDKERQLLAEAGITLAEGALPKAFNENFLLYLAMTRASEHLTLSYAGANEEGEGLESSLVVKRLQSLGYCGAPIEVPFTMAEGSEEDYVWRPMQSLSLLSERWGDLFRGIDVAPVWWGLYNWARESQEYRPRLREVSRGIRDNNHVPVISKDLVTGLFLKRGYMTGSVTRLEKYQQCPFKFYAQYGLKLEKRKVRSFGAPEIGTFLHANLERLGAQLLADNKQWRDLDDVTQQELCSTIAADILANNRFDEDERSAYDQAIEDRIVNTLQKTVSRLVTWSKQSSFNTKFVEQDFGRPGSWQSIKVPIGENYSLNLIGQIDRIDEYEQDGHTYGMVIDYKSGNTSVNAQDVYYGLKLQLVTYLLALERAYKRTHGESMTPAAVLYTYVKNPRTSVKVPISYEEAQEAAKNNGELSNKGYVTDNVDVLQHIDDKLFTYSGKGPYVPVRVKKSGDIYTSDRKSVKSSSDFNLLCRYAESVMSDTGKAIGHGQFPIAPYNLNKAIPCSYCDYKTVCRFDNERNTYRYLKPLQEEHALLKMEESLKNGHTTKKGGEA
ncbi:PD-(D/E)XK nuclease family protein [Veillonella agrestimuris]|uniref:PD-(D/E)XK nuclease family protein n=1 Tax=Veillonella agrestimuris TaxID=2941340 RepID=UPI00203F60C8|nr:PD-(D/E)XK nuclease family protein [Veillonella agrestimuris]